MNLDLQHAPRAFFLAEMVSLALGFGILLWGGRSLRVAKGVYGLSLLVLLSGAAFAISALDESGQSSAAWVRGWIWPKGDANALLLGATIDKFSLAIAIFSAALSAVVVGSTAKSEASSRVDRGLAAAAIAVPAVSLSWNSTTPWLGFIGLALSVFAGFLALGSHWEGEGDAEATLHYGRDRTVGLLLSVFGAVALTGTGVDFSGNAVAAESLVQMCGAAALFSGLFIQMIPFPFLGWAAKGLPAQSLQWAPLRYSNSLVFPSVAAFGLLVRLESQFRVMELFPAIGWATLGSVILAAIAGLLQTGWASSLGIWWSCATGLALTALVHDGPWSAVALLLGSASGSVALVLFGSALEVGGHSSASTQKRGLWARVGLVVAPLSMVGLIGFSTAGGVVHWLEAAFATRAAFVFGASALFLASSLAWKVGISAFRSRAATQASWTSVLLPFASWMLGGAWIWTGTLSGDVILGRPDVVFMSLLDHAYGAGAPPAREEELFWVAAGTHAGVLVVSALIGLFFTLRETQLWSQMRERLPRFTRFAVTGYGVSTAASLLFGFLLKAAGGFERVWTEGFLRTSIPNLLERGLSLLAGATISADRWMSSKLSGLAQLTLDLPARGLQAIQNGNVQWYLFFAVGSAFLLLLHFVR